MKRLVLAAVLLAGIFACTSGGPVTIGPVTVPTGIDTVYAQTLPITKQLIWDDSTAASDGVINYTVTLDGVQIGQPTTNLQTTKITTAGPHTMTVTATNTWTTSGVLTYTFNVVTPATPTNARFQ